MKRVLFLLVAVGATCIAWAADGAKEMDAAAQVLQNMTSSNQIPASLISQAKCIAVIPKLTKGGFIVVVSMGMVSSAVGRVLVGAPRHSSR